jgi:hypothetical protein
MFPSLNRLYRSIFDAKNGQNLPGDLVKAEGGAKKGALRLTNHMTIPGTPMNSFPRSLKENL